MTYTYNLKKVYIIALEFWALDLVERLHYTTTVLAFYADQQSPHIHTYAHTYSYTL